MRDRAQPGPVRTCIGCRTRSPAADLVRTVQLPDGSLVADRIAPGRGAWICRSPDSDGLQMSCLELADRRSAFGRALRASISEACVQALRATTSERARIEGGTAVDAGPSGRD